MSFLTVSADRGSAARYSFISLPFADKLRPSAYRSEELPRDQAGRSVSSVVAHTLTLDAVPDHQQLVAEAAQMPAITSVIDRSSTSRARQQQWRQGRPSPTPRSSAMTSSRRRTGVIVVSPRHRSSTACSGPSRLRQRPSWRQLHSLQAVRHLAGDLHASLFCAVPQPVQEEVVVVDEDTRSSRSRRLRG